MKFIMYAKKEFDPMMSENILNLIRVFMEEVAQLTKKKKLTK